MAEQPTAGGESRRVGLLAVLFVCSGAAGLVYEVAWSKRLELTFGTTHHSIGTVLAAYMTGLGLGAWLLGRWADRPGSPARRYALLEAGIGVYGLLAPTILDAVEWAFVAVGGAGGLGTKAFLGLLAMLPATFLMGGTLPVLARSLVRTRVEAQRAVGLLYGLNTLGAVLGVLLAGLWAIPLVGVDAASRWTGLVNLALAALALGLGSRLAPDVVASPETPEETPTSPESKLLIRVGVWGTFACGALALTLEVAWTRALALAFGASGHAFTIMLAATLSGIGLGSLIVARGARNPRAPLGQLALSLLLISGACYAFLLGFQRMPQLFYVIASTGALTYEGLLGVMFTGAALALLPATTALGIAFPLCVQLGTPTASGAGGSLGRLYLANTGGAILGALGGGFLLVVALGMEGTIRLGALLAALGSACLAWLAVREGAWSPERGRPLGALAVVMALAALALPSWNLVLLDIDPLRRELDRGQTDQPGSYADRFREGGGALLYASEGLNAFVTVRSWGQRTRVLRLGGKNDASTLGDMETQILLTAVPLMARPYAENVLVVGAGSGVSVRVAADHPSVKRVDVSELEESMIDAAKEWFDVVNDGVFDRDHVNVILEDARTTLLLGTGVEYDVIASEPTNPSIAGVANLFTLEHYETARERLTPGGVYAQWIQLYASSDPMACAMLRTFREAFPHVDVWWVGSTDLVLLGSAEPLRYDLDAIEAQLSGNTGLMRDLWPRLFCRDLRDLFARYVCGHEELDTLLGQAEVLRARFPRLEAWAARARYERRGTAVLLSDLRDLRRQRGLPPELLGVLDQERIWLARSRLAPGSPDLDYAGDGPEATRRRALQRPDRLAALRSARERFPDDLELGVTLGVELAAAGEHESASALLLGLEEQALSGPTPATYCLGRALACDPDDARVASDRARWAWAGYQLALPRRDELALRQRLLEMFTDAASQVPEVEQTLQAAWEAGEGEDLDLGLALARAQLEGRRPGDCVVTLDRLTTEHEAGYLLPLRLLRLSALDAARSPYLADELEDFLVDFPREAGRADVVSVLRRLSR